jgi:hypothetical protein
MRLVITDYRNAEYISNGWINVEINHPDMGWVPFTCDPNDSASLIDTQQLFDLIESNGDVAAYVPPTQEELDERAAAQVRAERDTILVNDVDPLVTNPLRWDALTESQQQAWRDYRTALLNVPQQEGFPNNVTWPTAP